MAAESKTSIALIGFGSNKGDSEAHFQYVAEVLREANGISDVVASSLLRTSPVGGPTGQNDYLNAAFKIQTSLTPAELHVVLIGIEQRLGRARKARWGARTVDLDLLIFDEIEIATDKLTIPHPRMSFRKFVLVPAVEVAPDLIHKPSQQTCAQLLDRIQNDIRTIVWAGDVKDKSKAAFDKLVSELASEEMGGWNMVVANSVEQFASLSKDASLVVCDRETTNADLLDEVLGFPGPMLKLNNADSETITSELVAAAQAMK